MDIIRWSTLKSDWLYSLQPKIEKLYTVNKHKRQVRCSGIPISFRIFHSLLWSTHSKGISLSLLHSVFQGQICLLPQVFLDFLFFAFQSPIMKRTSFGVLVLKGLVGLHRTVPLQLLQHYWSGHRLALLWYWMVCLGSEQRSFCHFWDCIQVLHSGLLLTVMATPFALKDSCPQ